MNQIIKQEMNIRQRIYARLKQTATLKTVVFLKLELQLYLPCTGNKSKNLKIAKALINVFIHMDSNLFALVIIKQNRFNSVGAAFVTCGPFY